MSATQQQKAEAVKALVMATHAISEAIREAGQLPSGELYAIVMKYMTLDSYEWIITRLIGAGLIRRERSHMLVWIGPNNPPVELTAKQIDEIAK